MTELVVAGGALYDRIAPWRAHENAEGLSPKAYRAFEAALSRTEWGSRSRHLLALTDAGQVSATAWCHDVRAVVDNHPLKACGVGPVRLHDHAPEAHRALLIDRIAEHQAGLGAQIVLLFSGSARGRIDAVTIEPRLVELTVQESPRYGAPMTMIRGGEDRDLPAMAAMGQVRAASCRFHLDRDAAFLQHAIARARLRAGLAATGARQLHFFIAEEGITAAAYVVISVVARAWTVEECGDRDVTGARVGAILQALIAREPAEERPTIRAWLPPGFCPPQVTIRPVESPGETMHVIAAAGAPAIDNLTADDVLYWRSDIF